MAQQGHDVEREVGSSFLGWTLAEFVLNRYRKRWRMFSEMRAGEDESEPELEWEAPDTLLADLSAEQRRVAARTHGEEEVGGAGERDDPRVLHDQPCAAVTRPPDVAGGDREGLGDVRPGDPHHVGQR